MEREVTPELKRFKTPIQFDIFDYVFINSSPLDKATLQAANELLNLTIEACIIFLISVYQYIQKLTVETEQLRVQNIIHQYKANNL